MDPTREADVIEPQRLPAVAAPGEINPLEVIERRNKLLEKILEYAIATTHAGHWVDLGGKPWLTGPGAEAVARRCAVKITEMTCVKEWMEDEQGRYYLYTYEAMFSLPGSFDSIIAYGHCSSRDSFLGTGIDTEEKAAIRDISEVDEGNIRQAAYTNCTVNGVTRLLGIRGMSWERLEALGLKQADMSKVEYKHGAKGGGASGAKTFTFRFGKGKDKTPEEVSERDLAWYGDCFRRDLADPEKAKYHANTQKQLAAVEAELQRRAAAKSGEGAAPPASPGPAASPWQRCLYAAAQRGIAEETLKTIVRNATGKESAKTLVFEDVAKIEAAIAALPVSAGNLFEDEGYGIPR